ncbi:MAG: YigZ family protein [Candidatus Latescibacterota bacterium]
MAAYQVPAQRTRVELRFRNSRFIGTADRADTVQVARQFIAQVRDEFPDASHHVYAFAVGHGASVTHGMSDDGEPSGTAGRPVLAVVQGSRLGDVAVVVTRYFGGTKLGTGGLVKAYTATAQEVLAVTPRHEKVGHVAFLAEMTYDAYAVCRRLLAEHGAQEVREAFGERVQVRARVRRDAFGDLAAALQAATAGRLTLHPDGAGVESPPAGPR